MDKRNDGCWVTQAGTESVLAGAGAGGQAVPTELMAGLTQLGGVYAPDSHNHRLLKSAVRELEGLYERLRDDDKRAVMQSMIIEEQAALISKLRNGMELARLAMSQA